MNSTRILASSISLSHDEALRIGRQIWRNECGGTIDGLTSWNAGEDFASLGIGHFIWYPAGVQGPFEESFSKLLDFIRARQIALPPWLQQRGGDSRGNIACPWKSRAEFSADQQSKRMKELRAFLAATIDSQAEFMVHRLQEALPKMVSAAGPDAGKIQGAFNRVSSTPQGCYALVDYVNFKGEGVLASERYHGEGWGLLQVLETMRDSSDGSAAANEFSRAASEVLRRRVALSPPERHEARWLPGWLNRVATYREVR